MSLLLDGSLKNEIVKYNYYQLDKNEPQIISLRLNSIRTILLQREYPDNVNKITKPDMKHPLFHLTRLYFCHSKIIIQNDKLIV